MLKLFTLSVATGALMLGASAAFALDPTPYMTGSGDSRMIMMEGSTTGSPVLAGNNGTKPADCPAGSYYDGPDETVVACDSDMSYGMMAPEAGMMMSDGKPYPEGSMRLEARENKM